MTAQRTSLALCLATAALLCGWPAAAQQARVDRAIAIFADSCAAYVDRPPELRTYLAKSYQRLPSDTEQTLLHGQRGQIWRTPEPAQSFGVFSYDDGSCEVIADDIDIEPMRRAFRAMMAKIVKDMAATVTTNKDEARSQGNDQTFTLLYVLQPAKAPPVTYILLLTQTPQGERRMRITVASTAGQR